VHQVRQLHKSAGLAHLVNLIEQQVKLREAMILVREGHSLDELIQDSSDRAERRGLKIALGLIQGDEVLDSLQERLDDVIAADEEREKEKDQ